MTTPVKMRACYHTNTMWTKLKIKNLNNCITIVKVFILWSHLYLVIVQQYGVICSIMEF